MDDFKLGDLVSLNPYYFKGGHSINKGRGMVIEITNKDSCIIIYWFKLMEKQEYNNVGIRDKKWIIKLEDLKRII